MQSQFLQNRFGILDQQFELVVAGVRPGEFEHLDFLELMLALQASGVAAGRSRFGAETRGPRAHFDRQQSLVDGFVAMQAGQFHLGRRREPQVRAFQVEHVSREFRQLADSGEGSGVNQKRRQNFGVAVLPGVQIEKEIGEGAFQPRAESDIHRETRTRDFYRRLEIQNARAFAQFVMRLRREIKLRRRAPAAYFDIIRRGFSHRHARVRNIRNHQQKILQPLVQLADTHVVVLDGVGNFFHVRQQCSGVFARLFHSPNFVAGLVALRLQLFGGENELAAFGINLAEWRQVQRRATVARHLLDGIQVVPYVSKIKHRFSRIHERRVGRKAAVGTNRNTGIIVAVRNCHVLRFLGVTAIFECGCVAVRNHIGRET